MPELSWKDKVQRRTVEIFWMVSSDNLSSSHSVRDKVISWCERVLSSGEICNERAGNRNVEEAEYCG